MSDEFVNSIIEGVIGIEGTYSNHISDRGGKTTWGTTKAVARNYGYEGEMVNLPRETAFKIYKDQYYTVIFKR